MNLQQVRRNHELFLAQNERMLEDASQLAGAHSVNHVKRYPTFTPRTGKLQGAQRFRVLRRSGGRLLFLLNDAPHANPIDKGSKPHPIVARRAPFLHFYWAKQRRWFIGKRVNHPGNKPYKFGYRAWRSAYRVEGQILRRRMTELASRF